MNVRVVACGAAAMFLGACGSEATEPRLADHYALSAVDGRALPAAIDSFTTIDGRTRLLRITGRYIVVFSPDSARYTVRTDIAERASDGALTPMQASCMSLRVGWRRAGSNVLMDYTGFPSPPAPPVDTLRISGRFLLQKLRHGEPADDAYVLSYVADGLGLDGCGFQG